MHTIGADFAIPDIIGLQLNQVGVGKWEVSFVFESRTIQAMGRVDVRSADKHTTIFDGAWLDISPLQDIVGFDATAWTRLDDHSFEISMSNGSRIIFFSSDSPYEEIIVSPEMWVF